MESRGTPMMRFDHTACRCGSILACPFGKPSDACAKPGAAAGLCAASPYRIEAQAKDDLSARLR